MGRRVRPKHMGGGGAGPSLDGHDVAVIAISAVASTLADRLLGGLLDQLLQLIAGPLGCP